MKSAPQVVIAVSALCVVVQGLTAQGGIVLFHNANPGASLQLAQEAAFQSQAGELMSIDFEDLANQTIVGPNAYSVQGVSFENLGDGGLILEPYPDPNFHPHSGINALFPFGGTDDNRESYVIRFQTPTQSIGFWIIDPEFPGATPESINFLDSFNQLIATVPMPQIGGSAGDSPEGNFFMGLITNGTTLPIATVEIIDSVSDQGEKVGLDDVQFQVPEPTTALMVLAVIMIRRRKH